MGHYGEINVSNILGLVCKLAANDGKSVRCRIERFDKTHIFGSLVSGNPHAKEVFQIRISDIESINGATRIKF